MKLLPFLLALAMLHVPTAPAQDEFIHCFDYGCKSTRSLSFDRDEWQAIGDVFSLPTQDAAQEKQQIRRAIAKMERIAGAKAGTEVDRGGNYNGEDLSMQQDCIDESTNTLQYLQALQRRGWLRFHRVDLKQRRIRWFFTHWSATIRQLDNGEVFAVDSWYRDNGQPPYLQRIEDWRRKADFSPELNPD